jgi:hypothetical protein
VAIQDKNAARLELQKDGTFNILKTLDQGDKKRLGKGKSIAKRALIASGAKEVFASKLVLGLHLMGGTPWARIGPGLSLTSNSGPTVSEVTAGSGFYGPHPFNVLLAGLLS